MRVVATNVETVYVNNQEQLQERVQRYLAEGGEIREQTDDSVTLFVKKKMNVVVLIVGLLLCLVPGLAYLIWYLTADQSQLVTVKVGAASNIGGYHPAPTADMAEKMNAARNDKPPTDAPAPAEGQAPTAAGPVTPPSPAPLGAADPATAIPATPPAPAPAPPAATPPAAPPVDPTQPQPPQQGF